MCVIEPGPRFFASTTEKTFPPSKTVNIGTTDTEDCQSRGTHPVCSHHSFAVPLEFAACIVELALDIHGNMKYLSHTARNINDFVAKSTFARVFRLAGCGHVSHLKTKALLQTTDTCGPGLTV